MTKGALLLFLIDGGALLGARIDGFGNCQAAPTTLASRASAPRSFPLTATFRRTILTSTTTTAIRTQNSWIAGISR